MIIDAIIEFFISILRWFFSGVNIPESPAEVSNLLTTIISWITNQVQLINWFIPLVYVRTLALASLAIYAVVEAYYLFWWVIVKIPFLDIKPKAKG